MESNLVESNLAQERQQAHAYLDRLPKCQLAAVHNLLESMLSPLERSLALAPYDDEPVTPEEAAAMEVAIASLDRGKGIPHEEILREFGLTIEDFDRMAEDSPSATR